MSHYENRLPEYVQSDFDDVSLPMAEIESAREFDIDCYYDGLMADLHQSRLNSLGEDLLG